MELISALRRKLIYSIALDYLGKDASPYDRVDDVVGCAESVTEILRKAVGTPVITGTWTLDDYLNRSKHWIPVAKPQAGDVLVSATGKSSRGKKAPFRGHTGIVGERGVILSNDSYTGKWLAGYTIDTWRERYLHKGGYPINYYRYKL